jgi:hypothetical protein
MNVGGSHPVQSDGKKRMAAGRWLRLARKDPTEQRRFVPVLEILERQFHETRAAIN